MAADGIPVSAVVPVDLLGKVVDHERIDALAAERGVPVLSDAAESLGATLAGRPAAAYGQVAAVSFNGNKVMTTSGGGALLTDDEAMAVRVRYLATQARQPVVHYEHTEVGYNYRMSNLLAALGRSWSTTLPSRSTGTTADTGMPSAATASNAWSSRSGLMLPVSSQSTNTGWAPVYVIAFAVAAKVIVDVRTAVPGPTPSVSSPRCSAAVPDDSATA